MLALRLSPLTMARWAGQGRSGTGRAVHQGEGRWQGRGEARKGLPHGLAGGLQDVDPVNGRRVHDAEADGQRLPANANLRPLPLPLRQRLRVADAGQVKVWGQDDAGRDDGAGQRPAPDLVQPGNHRVAVGTGQPLKQPQIRHTIRCFPKVSHETNGRSRRQWNHKKTSAAPGKQTPSSEARHHSAGSCCRKCASLSWPGDNEPVSMQYAVRHHTPRRVPGPPRAASAQRLGRLSFSTLYRPYTVRTASPWADRNLSAVAVGRFPLREKHVLWVVQRRTRTEHSHR